MDVFKKWHELGISTSIDDFGTGYSSLTHLKNLPMSELKIDRSFIKDLSKNRDDMMIVRSTLDISHNMNLRVVAEGVEDTSLIKILTELGCDALQGYLLTRPLPPQKFIRWLSQSDYAVGQDKKFQKPKAKNLRKLHRATQE